MSTNVVSFYFILSCVIKFNLKIWFLLCIGSLVFCLTEKPQCLAW